MFENKINGIRINMILFHIDLILCLITNHIDRKNNCKNKYFNIKYYRNHEIFYES